MIDPRQLPTILVLTFADERGRGEDTCTQLTFVGCSGQAAEYKDAGNTLQLSIPLDQVSDIERCGYCNQSMFDGEHCRNCGSV